MSKASYYKWADLPQTAMTPQIGRRLVSGEKVMIVQFTLARGGNIEEHKHPHEQMTHILSGKVEFDIQGEKRVISSGEVVLLPSNVPHAVAILEDTVTFDIFSPPREDFLTGEKADYMK